jgi:hypothetical protein
MYQKFERWYHLLVQQCPMQRLISSEITQTFLRGLNLCVFVSLELDMWAW